MKLWQAVWRALKKAAALYMECYRAKDTYENWIDRQW